jgi:hypothetical protein
MTSFQTLNKNLFYHTFVEMQHFRCVIGQTSMHKYYILLFLLFTSYDVLYSQNGSRWIFGDGVDIEFVDTGIVQRKSDFYSYECSSIFSRNNKVYYTNGEILYLNGDTVLILDGHNSASEGAYINMTNDPTISIFITEKIPKDSIVLFYYEVNNTSNQLLKKRIIALNAREQLGIVNHRNNNNNWVGSHFGNSDSMLFFLQGKEELICPVIVKGGVDYGIYRLPQLLGINTEFNSKGTKLLNNPYGLFIDLFDFDNEYPKISNHTELNFGSFYSVAFSPNGEFVYACHGNKLYQYDIKQNFLRLIKSYNLPFDYWGELQFSPTGKILLANHDKNYLSAILYPDKKGLDCSFVDTFLNLKYGKSQRGLPNFNASYFYTPSIDFAYTEDCWGHTYQFEGRDTFDADGYKWIFEKTGYRDSILTKNCTYTFPDTGKWQVSHIAWNSNRADTVTKTLTIRPKWQEDVLGKDTFYCARSPFDSAQGDFTLTLQAPPDMHCVHWNGEEPNLDETLGPILDYDHFHTDTFIVDTAGIYIVKLTNKTFCQMYDTITVREVPNPQKPKIQRNGHLLESSVSAHEYRWFLDGQAVEQASNPTYDPNQNGYWQVQLISEYGCESELSDSFLVNFASIDPRLPASGELTFKIYPNPNSGDFSVEFNDPLSDASIQIFDMNGKLAHTQTAKNTKRITINSQLAKGNYTVKLTSGAYTKSEVIVIE